MDITNLSALEIRKRLSSKDFSAKDILNAYVKNLEGKEENFISLDIDRALDLASHIDEKISRGERLGLLAGLPIGLKDNIITKDFKTTCGSKMLENYKSPFDASSVERIKSADGIILGKTKMDEFSLGSEDRTANAIKDGQIALGLGSDTGGQLRQAGVKNQIVAIKPSYGIVSRYGLVPLANTLDQIGAYGREVEDAVFMLSAITGFDPKDSTSFNNPEGTIIFGNFPKEIDNNFLKDMNDQVEKTGKILQSLGGIIEEVSLKSLSYGLETYEAISAAEFSSNMARFYGVRYGYRSKEYGTLDDLFINSRSEALGDRVKRQIILGTYLLTKSHRDLYEKALRIRQLILEDFNKAFKDYDLLLSPVTDDYKFTAPVNLGGLCGLSLNGVQFIGDRYKEANIIRAGFGLERGVKNGL